MNISKLVSIATSTFITLAIFMFVGTAAAQPGGNNNYGQQQPGGHVQEGWNYGSSHGMANCTFSYRGAPGQTVNPGIMDPPPPGNSVRLTSQSGYMVYLRLTCKREQSFDPRTGGLTSLGPEGTYSGPGGSGTVVGADMPGQQGSGYDPLEAKGREWGVQVGSGTHTLSWNHPVFGSDQITVEVVPTAGPVSVQQLAPIYQMGQQNQQLAQDAYDTASENSHDWENRIFAIQGGYYLGFDSLGVEHRDARQGYGFDLNLFLGDDENVRFLTGLHFHHDFDQKPIMRVPNQPTNGFNWFADWQKIFIGPKAGVEWMPASFFQLQAWGALGALISMDGNIPESQLPDKTLYTGEANTVAAVGWRLSVQPGFVIGDHFLIAPGFSVGGNLSELPMSRGPERICDQPTGDCYVMDEGLEVDATGSLAVGVQF